MGPNAGVQSKIINNTLKINSIYTSIHKNKKKLEATPSL